MKTYSMKATEVDHKWVIIDASIGPTRPRRYSDRHAPDG
jgi:hypothetical protein